MLHRNHGHYHLLTILALMVLVFVIVGGISYAAYLFVGATNMSDAAGLHLTKSINLATNDMRGKLYSNKERGIKDWMIYSDSENLFSLRYPNDWKLSEGEGFVSIKESAIIKTHGTDALAVSIIAGSENFGESSLRQFIEKRGIKWSENWRELEIEGWMRIETGCVKLDSGLTKELIAWSNAAKDRIIFIEATYFQENHDVSKAQFHKIASEFVIK